MDKETYELLRNLVDKWINKAQDIKEREFVSTADIDTALAYLNCADELNGILGIITWKRMEALLCNKTS